MSSQEEEEKMSEKWSHSKISSGFSRDQEEGRKRIEYDFKHELGSQDGF